MRYIFRVNKKDIDFRVQVVIEADSKSQAKERIKAVLHNSWHTSGIETEGNNGQGAEQGKGESAVSQAVTKA